MDRDEARRRKPSTGFELGVCFGRCLEVDPPSRLTLQQGNFPAAKGNRAAVWSSQRLAPDLFMLTKLDIMFSALIRFARIADTRRSC